MAQSAVARAIGCLCVLVVTLFPSFAFSQSTDKETGAAAVEKNERPAESSAPKEEAALETKAVNVARRHSFFRNVAADQQAVWRSPFRLRKSHLKWILPLAGATAAFVVTDHRTMAALPDTRGQLAVSGAVSQLGAVYTTFGIAAAFYLGGELGGKDRARETGMLATNALIQSMILSGVLKELAGRNRPLAGDGSRSFPSAHSMMAWSLASVVAHQYPDRKFVPVLAYGLATGVSLSRVGARKHFPSDVVIGSTLGWLIGRYVQKTHSSLAGSTGFKPRLLPEVQPAFSPTGFGMSLTWNLGGGD